MCIIVVKYNYTSDTRKGWFILSKNRILAIICSIALVGSITYGLQIYAEDSSIEYGSTDENSSSENADSLEDDSQEDEDTSTLDELSLKYYQDYSLEYMNKIVIVGDSIASGFKTYDRMPEEQVLAVGSLGARNIHSFQFNVDNQDMDILDALSIKQPQYIFMSMGMNDINLSTSEEYVENYTTNINDIFEICPNSTIIVMGITPVIYYSDFSDNDKIDTYNESLKQMAISMKNDGKNVYYINVSKYLKDDQNSLKDEFSSGDGIHLSNSAYDYIFTSMMLSLEWIM